MEERFYYCDACGNLFIAAIASGVAPYCCGSEMTLLEANTSDGNHEKHVPVVSRTSAHSIKVNIGTEPHPMTAEHGIRFICLETSVGGIIRYLKENDPPEACIHFDGTPIAVFAYCNLHGLWRADVPTHESECKAKQCNMK